MSGYTVMIQAALHNILVGTGFVGRGPQRAATGTGTDGRGHYIRRMYIVKKVPAKPI